MPTEIEICFYKPTGFSDTHVIDTDDRGEAVRQVMAKYGDELRCVNYILARLVDKRRLTQLSS